MNMPRSSKPKIQLRMTDGYKNINKIISNNHLNTVCEEARCPNIYDCWGRETATIMILGDICTRACRFCSVNTGKPSSVDLNEPHRISQAVQEMGLRHVLLTSVDRDDLKNDYGATIWAETITEIRKTSPNCTIEVLTPDFQGYLPALEKVFGAKPDIFSHNVESVERVSKRVRGQAVWQRSLVVLQKSIEYGLVTKSGMMVGLGETIKEVLATMRQVAKIGVKIFTIGQYLQPTKRHFPVSRYVEQKEFDTYKIEGLRMGFEIVESGSLVRSSYHADEQTIFVQKV
ncbi:MAG: lipoyl synthase [Candidatus Marinimicrobia bacterium]|nr:lipoyl synthase [Candidatus Neomarinimicrobiota bacterium]